MYIIFIQNNKYDCPIERLSSNSLYIISVHFSLTNYLDKEIMFGYDKNKQIEIYLSNNNINLKPIVSNFDDNIVLDVLKEILYYIYYEINKYD